MGQFFFDTGESPSWNDKEFISSWSLTKRLIRVNIQPQDRIVSQLQHIGIEPKDLQAIVLGHLHGDHTGGSGKLALAAPNVPIYVSREHWEKYAKQPFWASLNGCNPQHWPKSFSPVILDYNDGKIGLWENSHNITADGSVIAVDTSGHVPGHLSLIVKGDNPDGSQTTYFVAGDATYSLDQLNQEHPDGVNGDPERALRTMKRIKRFAQVTIRIHHWCWRTIAYINQYQSHQFSHTVVLKNLIPAQLLLCYIISIVNEARVSLNFIKFFM